MAADYLLSAVEFRQLAVSFCKKQHDFGNKWKIGVSNVKDESSEMFITSERVVSVSNARLKPSTPYSAEEQAMAQDEEDDSVTVCERPAAVFVTFNYHIVYSHTYQVPVLYFSCCYSNGGSLSLEDVWSSVPQMHEGRVARDSWSVISQGEHPILGCPFFFVHPCNTSKAMKALWTSSSKIDYFTSWLSMFGPLVGVHLPLPT